MPHTARLIIIKSAKNCEYFVHFRVFYKFFDIVLLLKELENNLL